MQTRPAARPAGRRDVEAAAPEGGGAHQGAGRGSGGARRGGRGCRDPAAGGQDARSVRGRTPTAKLSQPRKPETGNFPAPPPKNAGKPRKRCCHGPQPSPAFVVVVATGQRQRFSPTGSRAVSCPESPRGGARRVERSDEILARFVVAGLAWPGREFGRAGKFARGHGLAAEGGVGRLELRSCALSPSSGPAHPGA